MKNSLRVFHLPVSEELYEKIRAEARKRGLPAKVVARELLEEELRKRRRQRIGKEILSYAREHAGTPDDLDPAFVF